MRDVETGHQRRALALLVKTGELSLKRRGFFGATADQFIDRQAAQKLIARGHARLVSKRFHETVVVKLKITLEGRMQKRTPEGMPNGGAPAPWSVVALGKPGAHGRYNLYIVDANNRKIAAVWGKDGEREATADMMCSAANAAIKDTPVGEVPHESEG